MSNQTVEEKIPTLKDFPVEWQIILRATQSLVSKAKDGADIEILRSNYSFVFNTRKSMLEVVYNKNRNTLEILWMKYEVTEDGEREPIFIKTYEKRIDEKEVLDLIATWYEKIMYHIKEKSYATEIYRDFFYLYNMFEELKKEREEKKERDEK